MEEEFEAALLAPSRPAKHERDAIEIGLNKAEQPNIAYVLTEQFSDQILGLGTLNSKRRHVGFGDLDIPSPFGDNALAPEQHVVVGNGKPVAATAELHQHRVVQDVPIVIAHRHILALPFDHVRDVARCEVLGCHMCVGSADLYLSFNGDIPDRDAVDEAVVLGLEVTKRQGQHHLVVDGDVCGASGDRRLVERRCPNAWTDGDAVHTAAYCTDLFFVKSTPPAVRI